VRAKLAAALAVGLASLCFGIPIASASFHLIKVREVFPGSLAHPNSGYVELQMYAAGQNLVQNGELRLYNAGGGIYEDFKPTSQVASGASQSTVLIADTEYSAQLPSGPAPDFTDPGLNLSPAGGAVCWPQTEPPFDDCASWGGFTGQAQLASRDTAPAPAIPDGMAVRRSIAGGACATMLEASDDTDDSAVDFFLTTPAPRDNASPVLEATCRIGTPPEEPPHTRHPQTTLRRTPAKRTHDRTPTFGFGADERQASFQCRVDAKPFRACRSPYTLKRLAPGRHRLSVRARDDGNTDPTPATFSFTVLR
jgi:hypothetical protein